MKIFLGLFLAFVFCLSVSGQSVQVDESKRLIEIEKEIALIETEKESVVKEIAALSVKYSSAYYEVKLKEAKRDELNTALVKLYLERKNLASKKLVKSLPNNDIELLKFIITQNEKIIDLLERLLTKN